MSMLTARSTSSTAPSAARGRRVQSGSPGPSACDGYASLDPTATHEELVPYEERDDSSRGLPVTMFT